MLPEVRLVPASREDVQRVAQWLQDPEVNASWYGTSETGEPLHIGYSPKDMIEATEGEWQEFFGPSDRKIYSVYTAEGEHIGEAQMVIEEPLLEAQLFVLIGQKNLWHQHYGSAAMIKLLDIAFTEYGLHRVWVDVPEYNAPALRMCEHIGFELEGRLRSTRLKDGKWYDSIAMGLLSHEYPRRRLKAVQGA